MKNIQVIDGARNCTFSIFQATDEEFRLLFPEPGQDIQFADDFEGLPDQEGVIQALGTLWTRPIKKPDAMGIHGTIFYQLEHYREVYPGKRESSVDPRAISPTQRKPYGI